MFLNVSICLGTVSIYFIIHEGNNVSFFSLPIALECCEDLSLIDRRPESTAMSTVTNSQHIWMLNGGGHVSAEIKDRTTPGMGFVTGTKYVNQVSFW